MRRRTFGSIATLILCQIHWLAATGPARAADPAAAPPTIASADAPAEDSPSSESDPDTSAIDVAARRPQDDIEEMPVVYPPPAERTTSLPLEAFDSGRARNVSEALMDIPGVSGVKIGANGSAPVVRGLGWERVPIQIKGLPVMGAGPGQMDTPATLFGSTAIQKVEVVKGLPSVALGPGATGGNVLISTDYERPGGTGNELEAGARGTYSSDRDAFEGSAYVGGGTDRFDGYVGVDGQAGGDYTSAGGVLVPATSRGVIGTISLGFRPADGQRVNVSYVDSEYWNTDFPSRNLDSDHGWARIVNAGYRYEDDEGVFRGLSLNAGYAGAKHWMDNSKRPTRAMMLMGVTADADSFNVALDSDWQPASRLTVKGGVDFNNLFRDAIRNRVMFMMMGPMPMTVVSRDRVWPDIFQWDVGLYGEGEYELTDALRLRAGGRYDRVEGDARAASELGFRPRTGSGLPWRTIRENYVVYNQNPAAARTARSDDMGSGNLLLEWEPIDALETHLGGGVVMRAPMVSERYFALPPVPGGFNIGNPDLSPETRYELELGLGWTSAHVDFSAQAFYRWFSDYINPTLLRSRNDPNGVDVDGNGSNDDIWGYRNVDARMYGAEANLTVRFLRYLSLPMTVAYVQAWNDTDRRHLPLIPPLEARFALRVDAGERHPWWGQFGARIVAAQNNVDPTFPEYKTPGFEDLNLRGGVELIHGLSFELGIENLLDQDYTEHLTRLVPSPVAGLMPGDTIPEPGRHVYVTLRWVY